MRYRAAASYGAKMPVRVPACLAFRLLARTRAEAKVRILWTGQLGRRPLHHAQAMARPAGVCARSGASADLPESFGPTLDVAVVTESRWRHAKQRGPPFTVVDRGLASVSVLAVLIAIQPAAVSSSGGSSRRWISTTVPRSAELAAGSSHAALGVLHPIEETTRHNGHIDIPREMAEGVTGT
jgi:hypothetical protein